VGRKKYFQSRTEKNQFRLETICERKAERAKKGRAVRLVGEAVKAGTLERGACEVCGSTKGTTRIMTNH